MKFLRYIIVALPLALIPLVFTQCNDESGINLEEPKGSPEIIYVRVPDPTKADSLLVRANLGSGIVLVGRNLGGTREVWFNDRQAVINPSWVTNRTIFVSVPSNAPDVVTDMIYLVNDKGETYSFPFEVSISAPEIYAAQNEWPQTGEPLIIHGDFFFDPVVVTYTGGVTGEVLSVSQNLLIASVPEGATEGPVTVQTNFGEAESNFHVWDSRNIVLDFDGKNPNAWRIGLPETGDGEINGNYNVFRGTLNANQRDEGPGAPANSGYLFEYWGGNDASRTENFYPYYPNSYREYVMKFEAKVNTWYGGVLNICMSTPDHAGNNQEIWSNNLNARAIWAPWQVEGEEFSTEGQWITVTIPITEFQYYMNAPGNVEYTPGQKFIETAAGSLSMWLLGSPENTGNTVEFYVDNIRFVPL